ncbi:hypothetical protein P4O66_004413 [Electrophorus voltai]|uniref:Collectrin-like domain-containing protein n=1 Tax=Electrophorus voltai TaxID=2609070 RepID=A0AAD8ZPW3_9TELE|nr:hypothetical protein P4O66_004413 [Electrophorus voltai]
MLELGRSKSWTRALEQVSAHTRMDAQPLLNYFSTLYDWLRVENQKTNNHPGWNVAHDPYSENAIKYPWNGNELYLFKASMAYAMRQYYLETKGEEANFMTSRGRINAVFQLNDATLEFEGLRATLAPPTEQPANMWLAVFGGVMGVTVCAGAYLVITGAMTRMRKAKKQEEPENPYVEAYEGTSNQAFENDSTQTGF